jgi:phosphoribosylamine--glycine ligase
VNDYHNGRKGDAGVNSPKVAIVMGSESDLPIMEETRKILKGFGVSVEMTISSAHRTPVRTAEYARTARERGIEVIIAGAGAAAHLAGALAAHSLCPVIGVPIDATPISGFDALLSTVQMPPGVPVATVGIGKMGAKNAGYLAVQMLALKDADLLERLKQYRMEMEKKIEAQSERLSKN